MPTTPLAEPSLIEILRASRGHVPPLSNDVAAGLRAQLTDGLFPLLGARRPDQPLVVRASTLRAEFPSHDVAYSPFGRIRGALVTQLLRLHTVGCFVGNPYGDAVSAWRASEGASELIDVLDTLDNDERARLATDVTAHAVTLFRRLGSVPTGWQPRTAVRSAVRLGGGLALVRDHVDLVLGSNVEGGSGTALIDVTTAPLDVAIEQALRFHAVVATLRSSVAPRFVAALSTATGDVWRVDVDDDLLRRGVDELLLALEKVARS